MNIVFFGSSNFSLYFLEHLFNKRNDVLTVITVTDKPKGRGLKLSITPVKEFCLKNNIKVYQFDNINSVHSKETLEKLKADLFVVVSFGQIISKEILEIPKLFSINVHASLLPKYRGAAPINWAIIKGEKETGISIIKMVEKLDAGPIILQRKIDIDITDDASSLEKKIAYLGKELLIQVIENIENNNLFLLPQNDKEATFAPKLKKRDGLIDWSKSAEEIYNLIRGCYGWPSAFTYYNDKLLKIYKAEYLSEPQLESDYLPGQITDIMPKAIIVNCRKSKLLIKELQLEGKKRMTASEFICGYKIKKGEILG
ncbi:MAG: methionyl-tRNA formyltransferase [Candidatus Omnitrophica bacterium]|nr:methionyl-tRNA formyltransferase [Candidatus Omnitrophota bacterium]